MNKAYFVFALVLPFSMTEDAAAQKAVDHLQLCIGSGDQRICEVHRKRFGQEFPKAYAGDYQARRNVAFCLSYGCDGAVRVNRMLGCAWRMVIVRSGSPRVEAGDLGNQRIECGRLSPDELAVAERQAQVIAGGARR